MKLSLTQEEVLNYLDNIVKQFSETDWHDKPPLHLYYDFRLVIRVFEKFEVLTPSMASEYYLKEDELSVRRVRIIAGKYKGMEGQLKMFSPSWNGKGRDALVRLNDIYYKDKRISWSRLEFYRCGKWCKSFS